MIDEKFSLHLIEKVAQALVGRIAHSTSEPQITETLDQIRRLVTEGRANRKWLRQALEASVMHQSLATETRHAAERELADRFPTPQIALSSQSGAKVVYRSNDTLIPGDWPTERLESCGWTRVVGDELVAFLAQLNPIDGRTQVSASGTECHWRTLPWYETAALIRVHDPDWADRNLAIYYLSHAGNLMRLNGTSPPVHDINAKEPIVLTDRNALDYLKFFCFFVRGDEGPFFVINDETDPLLPPASISALTEETRKKLLVPATIRELDAQGRFRCQASVFYGNAIFLADFLVNPGGMIEITDDKPLQSDLPELIKAPIK